MDLINKTDKKANTILRIIGYLAFWMIVGLGIGSLLNLAIRGIQAIL